MSERYLVDYEAERFQSSKAYDSDGLSSLIDKVLDDELGEGVFGDFVMIRIRRLGAWKGV